MRKAKQVEQPLTGSVIDCCSDEFLRYFMQMMPGIILLAIPRKNLRINFIIAYSPFYLQKINSSIVKYASNCLMVMSLCAKVS